MPPPPPGPPAFGTLFDTNKCKQQTKKCNKLPIYSDDSSIPPPPPPLIERLEDGQSSTPRHVPLSDDMIASPHDSDKSIPCNAQEGTYSDEEEHTEKPRPNTIKRISVEQYIKLDETTIQSLKIDKSAKSIQPELSLTNTNSVDTNEDAFALDNSLFSDSETSLFSKSKSIIFLNENDEEETPTNEQQNGGGDGDKETKTKKEDDEATIREYEEYIKKHNKRKRKKKRSKKRKYNSTPSPLVITESNSTHLWDLYSFEDAIDISSQHPALYEQDMDDNDVDDEEQEYIQEEQQVETPVTPTGKTSKCKTKKRKMAKKKRSKSRDKLL